MSEEWPRFPSTEQSCKRKWRRRLEGRLFLRGGWREGDGHGRRLSLDRSKHGGPDILANIWLDGWPNIAWGLSVEIENTRPWHEFFWFGEIVQELPIRVTYSCKVPITCQAAKLFDGHFWLVDSGHWTQAVARTGRCVSGSVEVEHC